MGVIDTDDDFDTDTFEVEMDEDGTEAEQVNDGDIPGTGEQVDQDGTEQAEPSNTEGETPEQAEARKEKELAAQKEKELADTLEAFKSATLTTLTDENRDASTGVLPSAVVDTVMQTYAKLSGAKGKNAAKSFLQEEMQARILTGNPAAFLEARSVLQLLEAIKAGAPKEQIVRTPVDPTEAHVDNVAAMLLAPNLVVVPEGVAEDWKDKATAKSQELHAETSAYLAWMQENVGKSPEEQTAAPEVSPIVLAAAKIATGRAAGRKASTRTPKAENASGTTREPFTGERGDIGRHIESAFEGVQVGEFLTISEIVNHVSSEYGGDKKKPSPGAVAARLFPKSGKCSLVGVKPEDASHGREKKGAVKVA